LNETYIKWYRRDITSLSAMMYLRRFLLWWMRRSICYYQE
jgi:hypothetical protein